MSDLSVVSQALAVAAASGMAGSEVLVGVVTNEMFGKAIQGLTMVSNAGHQGELMTLIRDVLVRLVGLFCGILNINNLES